MAGRLLPEDYALIKQMIAAEAAAYRKPSNGLLRRGQVQGYDPISQIAQVRMDDATTDEEQIDVENITSDLLVVGMFVHVLFQDPSGAYIVGTATKVPAIGCDIYGDFNIPDAGADITIPTGGGIQVDQNNQGIYDPSTGEFTIPEGLAGIYSMTLAVGLDSALPTRFFVEWSTVGFTWRNASGAYPGGGTGVMDPLCSVATILRLREGQTMTPGAYQISGGADSASVHMHMWLLQLISDGT